MTWAEILVEKQAIIDNEFMSQIIAIVLLVFFLIMFSASVCSKGQLTSECLFDFLNFPKKTNGKI